MGVESNTQAEMASLRKELEEAKLAKSMLEQQTAEKAAEKEEKEAKIEKLQGEQEEAKQEEQDTNALIQTIESDVAKISIVLESKKIYGGGRIEQIRNLINKIPGSSDEQKADIAGNIEKEIRSLSDAAKKASKKLEIEEKKAEVDISAKLTAIENIAKQKKGTAEENLERKKNAIKSKKELAEQKV